jgi:hypothetical protein
MFPFPVPPVLSTAIHGLSFSVVVAMAEAPGLASTGAPNVWQSSVDRATPIAGLPPIVAISA